MRKTIFAVLASVAAALVVGVLPAGAHTTTDTPSAYCNASNEVEGVLKVGTKGPNSASVCVDGLGAVTVQQHGETSGRIVVDGDNNNPLTAASQCLDGHVAVGVDGEPYVHSDDGEFSADGHGHNADYYQTPQSENESSPDPVACADQVPSP